MTGFAAEAAPATALTSPASSFVAVQPTRFLDTVRGVGVPVGPVGAGTTVTGSAAGLAPEGTTAVVLNLWAESPTADSAVTVFPHGTARPSLPSLLLQNGKRRSNQVTVQVGADRMLDFHNASGSTHLIASIMGYYTTVPGSRYTPVGASRLPVYSIGPNATTRLNLTGHVPATATAVTFSATLSQPTVATYLTASPAATPRPTMASVAAYPGGQGSNLITVKIGANRSIDLYNLAGTVNTDLNVVGFYAADYGALFTPVAPERVLDGRTGLGTWDGQPKKIGPNTDIAYRLRSPLPSNTLALALNLTGHSATADTAITAWDLWTTREPPASVHLGPGQTISVAVAPVVTAITPSPSAPSEIMRSVYVHNRNGSVDVTADLSGYFTLPPADCQSGCVSAWGPHAWEQGTTAITDAKPFTGLSDVVALAGSSENGVALRADGTVKAWGGNSTGQLGNGWWATVGSGSAAPVPVVGLTSVKAIGRGGSRGYAVKTDGTVWQWGQDVNAPVQVAGLTGGAALATGWGTAYVLKTDGTVWAWGDNTNGELGNGSTVARSDTPVRVSGLTGIKSIGAGTANGYAVKADGTLVAWGYNSGGQLGNGVACTTPSGCVSRTPVPVTGLTGVTSVTDGMALREDGTVYAWGSNLRGALGNGLDCESGTGPDCTSTVPVRVGDITDAKAIGNRYAVRADGTVLGWGDNQAFRLGATAQNYPYYTTVPVRIPGLSGVKAITDGLALRQ
ncbi:RCC1 domain-containing protein [Amycolatopsis sp. lyj-90]|uniref:RCC1 domain-containing protein n=1 Tax=Amycolatopsis sp. lyj-90 TaxID=2789285 RepID=UPI00397AB51B